MEIVVRAAIVFVLLFVILRVMGKRELSEMSAFELVVLIVLGDLVESGIVRDDDSITGGMLAVGTFVLLGVLLSWFTWRFRSSRDLLDGAPTVVVRDGKILDDVAEYERLPFEELYEAMRGQGIRSVGEVDLGVLEPDGSFSFFTRATDGS